MLRKAVEWCEEKGLIFDAVNENLPEIVDSFGSDTRKIFANEYIDDRNFPLVFCREKSNKEFGCYERALKSFNSLWEDGGSL